MQGYEAHQVVICTRPYRKCEQQAHHDQHNKHDHIDQDQLFECVVGLPESVFYILKYTHVLDARKEALGDTGIFSFLINSKEQVRTIVCVAGYLYLILAVIVSLPHFNKYVRKQHSAKVRKMGHIIAGYAVKPGV